MSLCYDFQKWTIISLTSVTITLIIGLIILLNPFAHGQSDFYLEGNVRLNENNPFSSDLFITKFEFQGQALKDICPSGQCEINSASEFISIDESHGFTPPAPGQDFIMYKIDFKITNQVMDNASIGPKEKKFFEPHVLFPNCYITDIIEDKGQEIYLCGADGTDLTRKYDDKTWEFNTRSIYDAKKGTFKVNGTYTGMSE